MKSLVIIATILSAGVFAQAQQQQECQQEGQIIAKVLGTEKKSMTECRLYVDIIDYRESIVCPLDRSEVISEGIEIGMKNGHDCETDAKEVSGYLVKNKAGVIRFD